MSKRSDISDVAVVRACKKFSDEMKAAGIGLLMPLPSHLLPDDEITALCKEFNCPEKVAIAAMYRADSRGLIEYGVSLRTAWPTDLGLNLLQKAGSTPI